MARFERITRRSFIADLGRAGLGIVVFGVAACARDDEGAAATSAPPARSPEVSFGGWHRVNLGMVSAYILVRGGEAVLVDTGVEGKASDIESALSEAGSSWNELGHLILTHKHPDHIGSAGSIIEEASEAVVYAGEEDIPAIELSRKITAVADGDDIAGLRVIGTPGHTPGHVSVLDPTSRVFVAGDAMVGENGGAAKPPAQYTEDMDEALRSVSKVAELDFDIVLFGHGEPITAGGKAKVATLAEA